MSIATAFRTACPVCHNPCILLHHAGYTVCCPNGHYTERVTLVAEETERFIITEAAMKYSASNPPHIPT